MSKTLKDTAAAKTLQHEDASMDGSSVEGGVDGMEKGEKGIASSEPVIESP